jgi:hypothetical protein
VGSGLGEILVQRDEDNRIIGVVVRDLPRDTVAEQAVLLLLRAAAVSLTEYLHVAIESSISDEVYLAVDRGDPHLDRELDAVLETVILGFRLIEKEHCGDVVVHEATAGVEVL